MAVTSSQKRTHGSNKKAGSKEELKAQGRIPGGASSQEALTKMGLTGENTPRNSEAYGVIAQGIPGFKATHREHIRKSGNAQVLVDFESYPLVNGLYPSLADLAEYALLEPGQRPKLWFDRFPKKVTETYSSILAQGEIGEEFVRLLMAMPCTLPPKSVADAIGNWFKRVVAGEQSTIFSGVCPDYATVDGKYTFATLGNGVGLVASRVLAILPQLSTFIQTHSLNINLVVAIGDFEGDSEETCRRLNLTREEFTTRMRLSQAAFQAACDATIRVQTPLATEISSDWYNVLAKAHVDALQDKLSGSFVLTDEDLQQVCNARRSLYERWYGEGVNVLNILRRQAPEYGAMGTVACDTYPNSLILGGDHPMMSPFWQGLATQIRPVVYLKKVDY